jgi:hypothetical protein
MPQTPTIIASLINGRPLCLDCIASKAGVDQAKAEVALTRIHDTLTLQQGETGRCRACGSNGAVFSVN